MYKDQEFSTLTSDMTEMQSEITAVQNNTTEMQSQLEADASSNPIPVKKSINWVLWGSIAGGIFIITSIGVAIYKNKKKKGK